MPNLNTTE